MSESIDKLFNTKLASHVVQPSPQAWDRVAAELSKKNKGLIWFRWAAVLLIPVLITGGLLWINSENKTGNTTAINSTKSEIADDKKKNEAEEAKSANGVKTRNDAAKQSTVSPKTQSKSLTRPATAEKAKPVRRINTPVNNMNAMPVAVVASDSASDKEMVAEVVTPPAATVTVVANDKPIVLEYTLTTIEAVLPAEKPITLVVVLNDKPNKNKLQKVIDFARDAKNSEGPFATLRQAKEEFFAFNFKKDKNQK